MFFKNGIFIPIIKRKRMGDEDYSSILRRETGCFSESGLYAEYFNNPSSCCIPNIFMPETENTGDRDTFTIGDLSIPRAQLKPTKFLNIPQFDIQLYDITATPLEERTVLIYNHITTHL